MTRARLHRATSAGGEDGAAMVTAVIVMVILATLSTALIARTLSVMNFVRHGQNYDAALAAADAGVADALFKIDQQAPASWTLKCPADGAGGACPVGAGTFEYWAQKISDSEYVISAVGGVGDSKHGVQVRVTRSAQFPYALFSRAPLHLDGSTAVGNVKIGFYTLLDATGSGKVRVGSNSTVVCNGTLPANVIIDWYQTQSECPAGQINQLEKPRNLHFEEPPPPAGVTDPNWENCPTSLFVLDAVVSGNDGPYVCRQNVVLAGTVTAKAGEEPVQLYIAPRYDADGTVAAHYSLDLSLAVVNPDGPARRFQIYKSGDEPIAHNTLTDVMTFRGVLFAPDTAMTINGGNLNWAGSINVGQLKVNGAPNLKVGYDFDLSTYLGPDWRVSRYREIPSSEAEPVPFP